MAHNTQELSEQFSDLIESSIGEHCAFDSIKGYEFSNLQSLIFVQESHQFDRDNPPAVIVTTKQIAAELASHFSGFIACVNDVKLAQAQIKQHFDDYQAGDLEWQDIP